MMAYILINLTLIVTWLLFAIFQRKCEVVLISILLLVYATFHGVFLFLGTTA